MEIKYTASELRATPEILLTLPGVTPEILASAKARAAAHVATVVLATAPGISQATIDQGHQAARQIMQEDDVYLALCRSYRCVDGETIFTFDGSHRGMPLA